MLPTAVLCDFDGTIVPEDVSEELLAFRGSPEWWDIDLAFQRGEIGSRECATRQVALLAPDEAGLLGLALQRFRVDPTFPVFADWCRGHGIEVSVVSDGFSFYIEPMLAAAGVTGIPIVANRTVFGEQRPRLEFPHAHATCVGCGTCKMNAVIDAQARAGGPVAFVGEGHTDRFGALYADIVFAKKHLPGICDEIGVEYLPWETFEDVQTSLDQGIRFVARPGGLPRRCPGWTEEE